MIKILVTIGPISNTLRDVQYFATKTKLFRLNGSHSDLGWHERAVNTIREAASDSFILFDIPGSKPRTANMDSIEISRDKLVCFGDKKTDCDIHVACTKPLPVISGNTKTFSVNDGQFLFDIVAYGSNFICGKSRDDFLLLPRKGVNIPTSVYNENLQFEIYKEFIDKISHLDVTALGLSFVQTGALVKRIRLYAPNLLLISKIENSEGLKNCVDIIEESDGVMIDRGDLAAEIGLEGLFDAIEHISHETKKRGKPLIMATENLETMVHRGTPSKSEVVSLSHSAAIGVDCIMLSEETAVSKNARPTLDWLYQFVSNVNAPSLVFDRPAASEPSIWDTINCYSNLPFVIMSKSGRALFKFFGRLPNNAVIVVSDNHKLLSLTKLYRNSPVIVASDILDGTPIETIRRVVREFPHIAFDNNEFLVAVSVSKYEKMATANTLTIFSRHEFGV